MISGLTWAVFHFSSPPPWAMAISWGTTSSVKWCKGSEEIYVIVSLLLTLQILLSKKIELSNKTHPCALPIALPIFGPPCLLRKYKSIFSDNTVKMTLTSSLASDQVLLKPSPPSAGASGRTWRSSLYESWRSSLYESYQLPFWTSFRLYEYLQWHKQCQAILREAPALCLLDVWPASKSKKLTYWMLPSLIS